jgi:hypothetical protein
MSKEENVDERQIMGKWNEKQNRDKRKRIKGSVTDIEML